MTWFLWVRKWGSLAGGSCLRLPREAADKMRGLGTCWRSRAHVRGLPPSCLEASGCSRVLGRGSPLPAGRPPGFPEKGQKLEGPLSGGLS